MCLKGAKHLVGVHAGGVGDDVGGEGAHGDQFHDFGLLEALLARGSEVVIVEALRIARTLPRSRRLEFHPSTFSPTPLAQPENLTTW